jgi:hypothetical protein
MVLTLAIICLSRRALIRYTLRNEEAWLQGG